MLLDRKGTEPVEIQRPKGLCYKKPPQESLDRTPVYEQYIHGRERLLGHNKALAHKETLCNSKIRFCCPGILILSWCMHGDTEDDSRLNYASSI